MVPPVGKFMTSIRRAACASLILDSLASAFFNVQFQTGQGIVPSARDDLEAPPTFREPGRVERPDLLAALTIPIDDPGGGKDVKVLGHALPRHHPKALREHRDRSRTTI